MDDAFKSNNLIGLYWENTDEDSHDADDRENDYSIDGGEAL